MRKVHLYGRLAEEFGSVLTIKGDSVPKILQILEANFQGKFFRSIREGAYRVVMGRSLEEGTPLSKNELPMTLGSNDLHIMPVVEGSGGDKGKGILTVVIGVALVATAFVGAAAAGGFAATIAGTGGLVSYQTVAMFGVSLALSGASALLTPTPTIGDYSSREKPEERASFLFNGPVNSSEQGGPVPVVYGQMRTGSVIISGGITTEQI